MVKENEKKVMEEDDKDEICISPLSSFSFYMVIVERWMDGKRVEGSILDLVFSKILSPVA